MFRNTFNFESPKQDIPDTLANPFAHFEILRGRNVLESKTRFKNRVRERKFPKLFSKTPRDYQLLGLSKVRSKRKRMSHSRGFAKYPQSCSNRRGVGGATPPQSFCPVGKFQNLVIKNA